MRSIFLQQSQDHRILSKEVEPHIVPRLGDVIEKQEENVFKTPTDGSDPNAPYTPPSLSDLFKKPEGDETK